MEVNNESARTENLLCKPFLLSESNEGAFASSFKFDSFVLNTHFNKEAIDWHKVYCHQVSTTRSAEQVRVYKTFDKNVVAALVKFQGKPGIPRLVAYYSEPTINNVMVYYALEEYTSRTPQPSLSTEDMVRQLLQALKLIHEECVEVGAISLATIRWQGDEIKFTFWEYSHYRGDAFNSTYVCPTKDVFGAGKVIQAWSQQYPQCDQQKLTRLAEAMTNPCCYRQISLDAALSALDVPRIIDQYFEQYSNIDNMTFEERLKCCDEKELNLYICKQTEEMFTNAPDMTHEEALKHIGITKFDMKPSYPHIYYSYLDDQENVITKIRSAEHIQSTFGLELFVSQLLSNKCVRCPELIKYHVYKNTKHPEHKFNIMMVFLRYSPHPPEESKNIFKFIADLFTAIKVMHELHLVHSDIAPRNIAWDDDGRAVLIDFGSTYFANSLYMSTPLDLMTFGHKGFMPNDEHRFYATDVYSAGKTVEYFAQQWGQWTNKLEDVVKLMTAEHWAARCSLKSARKLLEACDDD